MGRLAEAQEKLLRKVRANKDLWIQMVKKYGPEHFLNAVAELIAEEEGVSVDEVKSLLEKTEAYDAYKKFASNPEKYVDLWLSHIERAIKSNKWLHKYIHAFYPKHKVE